MLKKDKKITRARKALGGMCIIGAACIPAQAERTDKLIVSFAPEFYKAAEIVRERAERQRKQNGSRILKLLSEV